MVLQLWDRANPIRSIDLFVREPIEFSAMLRDSVEKNIDGHLVRVASIEHLVEMKRQASRPRDMEDIAKLLEIAASRGGK